MKVFNFFEQGKMKLGAILNGAAIDTAKAAAARGAEVPGGMRELIVGQKAALAKIAALFDGENEELPLESLRYAPAVPNPEKILCIGLNCQNHIEETAMGKPSFPALFSKFSNALSAHNEAIALPPASKQCDFEAELVIVIGRTAFQVAEDEAADYIFGYTVGNDLSARDLQMRTSQWLLGKTPDQFAPIGPYIRCAAGIDPNRLAIRSYLNGQLRQSSNTSQMIFNCAAIVSYLSRHMTLKPGDIIFTGTPEGVILGQPPKSRVWLKAGDTVVVDIEGIGALKNTFC